MNNQKYFFIVPLLIAIVITLTGCGKNEDSSLKIAKCKAYVDSMGTAVTDRFVQEYNQTAQDYFKQHSSKLFENSEDSKQYIENNIEQYKKGAYFECLSK